MEELIEKGVGKGNTFQKWSFCDSMLCDGYIPKPGKTSIFIFQVIFAK